MHLKRNNPLYALLCLAVCLLSPTMPLPLTAQSRQPLTIQLSSGLITAMIPRDNWSFIHAELIIPIHDTEANPLIPYLTMENMFDRQLLDNDTGLTNAIVRLGGDCQLDCRPGEIRLIINFPSDQLRDFAAMVHDIFTYQSFSLKRFDHSRTTFFTRMSSQPGWPFQIARSVAYKRLFPDHPGSRGPIQAPHFERLNLSQLRSFCSRVIKPERSLLVMTGDLNPHTTYGLIEMTLNPLRKTETSFPARSVPHQIPREQNRIICLESERFTQLNAYQFTIIPPVHDLEHFQERILYTYLFSVPNGRLYNLSLPQKLRPIDFGTLYYNHDTLSVIATDFKYTQHLGRLLDLLFNERRRLLHKPFEEREYLVASNTLLGQIKVETAGIGTHLDPYIHPIFTNKSAPIMDNPGQLLKINNFVRTVQHLGRKANRLQEGSLVYSDLICVTGNRASLEQFKGSLSPQLLALTETVPLNLN
jgi:hypothetical protein